MTVVWFNGPSRQLLIDRLPRQAIEIGCNYISRDRPVDYVCVFDRAVKTQLEIIPSVNYRTIPRLAHYPNWIPVLNSDNATNSGMLAVLLATQLSKEAIYVIGCDWGLTQDTVYDYGTVFQRKYNNQCRKYLELLARNHSITVVNDQIPDVTIPVIKINDLPLLI